MSEYKSSNRDYEHYIVELKEKIRKYSLFIAILMFIMLKITNIFVLLTFFDYFDISIGSTNQVIQTGNILFDLLGTRWDSYFYLTIAENGMYYDPLRPDDTRIWNFAPLYPFFTRIFMEFGKLFQIEIPVVVSGVVVANFFSLTSTIAFFYVSRIYLNEEKAIGATLLFSFFPTVFVFSTVAYSEPVFLTFFILSWFFFEKKQYPLAGLSLALMTLARYPGALIFFLYIPIYFGRKMKEVGLKQSIGCLLAIPLFPLLVIIKGITLITSQLTSNAKSSLFRENFYEKLSINQQKREKFNRLITFLDTGLSWVLIFGIIPFIWLIFVNTVAPETLSEIAYKYWGARFIFPLAGFLDMLVGGDVKWTIEKFAFPFLFIGIGLIVLQRRPSFSVLIIGQALFYTSFIGLHPWSVPRYIGTIFHSPLVLAEELASNKMIMLVLVFFLLYGFKALWTFCNMGIWLI